MPAAAPVCPPLTDYERLLSGDSSQDDVNRLAGHLEGCAKCAAAVQTLLSQDTLGSGVRGAARPSVLEKLPAALASKLLALQEGAAADGATRSGPGRASTETTLVGPALSPALAPDELGRLGGYRVLQVLGEGGMGLVYLAEDVQLLRRVALKVMKPELAKNDSARLRFLAEARAAAKVRSDHVVTIYQTGEDCGTAFAAMELLRGSALDSWLKKNRNAPITELVRIGRETALGLAAAHEEGLIHRDIKPANIWVESSGRIKILDFGLARPVDGDAHLTKSGAVVGTPAYMAPEQARGQKVDHRADLFSLGCVMHRLCTGEMPFKGDTVMAVLTALAIENPPPANELNPNVPPRLAALVTKLLSKDANKRPQSAREVADELQAIVDERTHGGSATVVYVPAPAPIVLPLPAAPNSAFDFSDATEEVTAPRPAAQRPRRRTPDAEAVPAAEPAEDGDAPKARGKKGLLIAAVAALLLVAGSVAAVLVFSTKDGTLTVEIADTNADVRFKNGKLEIYDDKGALKYTLEANTKEKGGIAPGKYVVKVVGADGVKLDTDEFTMDKGGKRTLTVRASGPGGTAGGPKKTDPKVPAPSALRLALSAQTKVEIPDVGLDVTKPFTVEAYLTPFVGYWERVQRLPIVDQNGAFGIDISEGQFAGYTHHDRAKGGAARPGERAHVALVMVADQRRLFVNGKLVHAMPGTLPLNGPGTAPIVLAFAQPHGEVIVEELRVSKVARYEKEFAPAARHERDKDTLALFHADEGAGGVLTDSSGNKKHGTITNPRWVKLAPLPPVPPSAAPPLSLATGKWPVGPNENVMPGLVPRPALIDAFGRWQLVPTAVPLGGPTGGGEPAFSPDGTKVAVPDRHALRVYDANTGALVGFAPRNSANPLAGGDIRADWSPDGKWVRLFDRRGFGSDNVSVWAADGAPSAVPWQQHAGIDFGWNPKFPLLAFWPHGLNKFHVVDPASAKPVELDLGASPPRGGQWSSDGEWFLLIREDKTAQLFDRAGKPGAQFKNFDPAMPIAWGKVKDGQVLTAPIEGVVHAWKDNGDVLFKTAKFEKRVTGMSWKPDGSVLAVADEEGKRHFFDADGKSVAVVETKEGDPRTLWVPDSDAFLVGAKHWPALAPASADLRRPQWGESIGPDLTSVAYFHDGRIVIEELDPKKGTKKEIGWQITRTAHGPWVWAPNGKKLAVTHADGTTVYDTRDPKREVRLGGGTAGELTALAVSPKADRFAVAADTGHVFVVGTDGKVQRTLDPPPIEFLLNSANQSKWRASDVRWHPDGKHVAVVRGFLDVSVYDADTGEQKARVRPEGAPRPGGSALFSPANPDQLLLAHPDLSFVWRWKVEQKPQQQFAGLGKLWPNADGKKVLAQPAMMGVHGNEPLGAALLAPEAFDKRDTATTGDLIGKPNVPAPLAAWHPDGKHLVAIAPTGTVEVRGPDGKVVAEFRGVDNFQHGTFVTGAPASARLPVWLNGEFAVVDVGARTAHPLDKAVRGEVATVSLDGKYLLAVEGQTVSFWNLETNQLDRRVLLLPGGESVAFTAAGEVTAKTDKADAGFRYAVEDKTGRVTARTAAEVAADLTKGAPKPVAVAPTGPALILSKECRAEAPNPGIDPKKPWTIEAYVTPLAESVQGVGAPLIRITDLGDVYFKGAKFGITTDGFRLSEQFMEVGKRVHIAAVRSETRVCLYVDGKLWVEYDAKPQAELGALPPTSKLLLGPLTEGYRFHIQDVRVSQAARYAKEFAPPGRHEADKDTLALYRCDEGAGDKLTDGSGNNRHGTITNPMWTKPAAGAPARRWPLNPTPPDEIKFFLAHHVELTVRDAKGEVKLGRDDAPKGPVTVVGANFWGADAHTDKMDDAWLRRFAKLTDLEYVNFSFSGARDPAATTAGFREFGALVHLREFSISHRVKGGCDASVIAKMPSLERLNVASMNGPEWVPHAVGLKNLRHIDTSFCALTDAELDRLAALPRLSVLSVNGPTPAAFQAFAKKLPWCRIVFNVEGKEKVIEPTAPHPLAGLRFDDAAGKPRVAAEVPGFAVPEGAFTLEGYVKFDKPGIGENPTLFGWTYQFLVGANGEGIGAAHFADAAAGGWKQTVARAADTLPRGQWNHVAAVRDGKQNRLYFNGELVAKLEVAEAIRAPKADPPEGVFVIGSVCDGVTFRDVRVSKVARYGEAKFAPAPLLAADPDTLALFRCDETSGDVLRDHSANSRNGKVLGGAWLK